MLGQKQLPGHAVARRNGKDLSVVDKRKQFEQVVLPHLDAAFNLARWLTSDDQDAQDVVQDAYLRAFKFFDSYHGGSSRAWLLTIVRNTTYTWLRQNRQQTNISLVEFDDDDIEDTEAASLEGSLLQEADYQQVREALAALPVEFREVIVLHDLEGLAYKEIALVTNIPLGTVMSRLSRARARLQKDLKERQRGL
jgi:RNA polymerase sigma factor (sigma-70 family)